jgi:hypothetical protein
MKPRALSHATTRFFSPHPEYVVSTRAATTTNSPHSFQRQPPLTTTFACLSTRLQTMSAISAADIDYEQIDADIEYHQDDVEEELNNMGWRTEGVDLKSIVERLSPSELIRLYDRLWSGSQRQFCNQFELHQVRLYHHLSFHCCIYMLHHLQLTVALPLSQHTTEQLFAMVAVQKKQRHLRQSTAAVRVLRLAR